MAWTAGIVAADGVYRGSRAAAVRTYQSTLADLERDRLVATAPLDEARTLAYLAAQTTYWTAEIGAASARRSAEATAVADWRGADYAANATAISSIDTELNLPWSEYQADKAAALAAWWTADERANFLALTTATNLAETAYQTTVNATFSAWTTQTAGAEKVFAVADANHQYAWQVAEYAADEGYAIDLAAADGDWQNAKAANLAARRADYWTDRRDAIAASDTTFTQVWAMVQILADPADQPADQAYFVAESTANGTRVLAKSTALRNFMIASNADSLAYETSYAQADEGLTIAEANARATLFTAFATADANFEVQSSDLLEDALELLAVNSATPWANYDAAVGGADEAFTSSTALAERDEAIAIANAERDFDTTKATAERLRRIANEQAKGARRLAEANAAHDRAVAEVTAEIAAAPTVPRSTLPASWGAPDSPQGTPGEAGGAPTSPGGESPTQRPNNRKSSPPTPKTPARQNHAPQVPAADPGDAADLESPIPIVKATTVLKESGKATLVPGLVTGYVDIVTQNVYDAGVDRIRLGRPVGRYTASGELQVGYMIERKVSERVILIADKPWYWPPNLDYYAGRWVETGEVIWGETFEASGAITFESYLVKQRRYLWDKVKADLAVGAVQYGEVVANAVFDIVIDLVTARGATIPRLGRVRGQGIGRIIREIIMDGGTSGDSVVDAGFGTLLVNLPRASTYTVGAGEVNLGAFTKNTPQKLGLKSIGGLKSETQLKGESN